nr:MFS transporter [Rhizobium redzepovicii]
MRHDTYRTIWFASLSSNFGGLIQAVGAAWMMTTITASEDMVALVQTSTALPIMLFSLISGALADNYDRRRVMLTAQCLMLTVSALLTVTALLGWITPWLLLFFTFLIGCGTALNNPSWQASVGDMVPRADLPGAVTLNSMGFNITRSVGPAIGGVIVAAAGAAAAFAVNTVSYLALIYALLRWRPSTPVSTLPREALGSAIFAGLRYVSMSPNLEKVLAVIAAFSPSAVLTSAGLLVSGACWVSALSLFNTIVQLSTPRWVVGRALSLYQTVTFGGIAGGSWLWGVAADRYGVADALLMSSVVMLLGIVIGLRFSMPAFASLNLDPLNRFTEPALSLDITPRSGPIVIQVDYEIGDDDLAEFMQLMGERRRIRIRDGARNWALMRDLENPGLWTETYHTPTWVEYIRHNQRRTQADAENTDRLRALHRGEGPLHVHRMIERQAIPPDTDVFHKAPIDLHH